MKIRIFALITALVMSLFVGVPSRALDATDCVSTDISFSYAGFDFLCDVELATSSLDSDRRKLVYRPAYGDYVFLGQRGSNTAIYSTSLTPGTTYLLGETSAELDPDQSVQFWSDSGVATLTWVSSVSGYLQNRQRWHLVGYEVAEPSNTGTIAYGFSKALSSEIFYNATWQQASAWSSYSVRLPSGRSFQVPYDTDYFDVPQIALQHTTGTGYSAWVLDRTESETKVVAYGFSSPDDWGFASGTEVLSYPASTEVFALDHDGDEYVMLVQSSGLLQLRGIDKFGTVTNYSSVAKFGELTDMFATPNGTFVEMATNESGTARKLLFLPKQAGFGRLVAESVEWTVSTSGKVAWPEQSSSGGFVIKEFSPTTLTTTTTSKLPFPALSKPSINYLQDGRMWISVPDLGSFIGRLSGEAANPSIDTSKLQSWYDPTSFIDLFGEDLQSIVDLDCTHNLGSCQVVMDPFTNKYKLRLALNSAPVGDASTSMVFQTSATTSVTKTFSYKVRDRLFAVSATPVISAGEVVGVTGASLDLISNVTFGPASEFVNPNIEINQSSDVITFTSDESLAAGEYTLKLFHPDKRGANYPVETISIPITVFAAGAPTFISITGNVDPAEGDLVRLTGTNLDQVTGVKVNGQLVQPTVATDTSLSFAAPALDVGSYPISVETDAGEVSTTFQISVATVPAVTGISGNLDVVAGDRVILEGSDLDLLTAVKVGGIVVTASALSNGDTWTFTVPALLAAGEHAVSVEWGGGVIDTPYKVTVSASSTPADDGEFSVWTKKISDTEVKMYAKNPVGAGKIQFFVNGEEYAWVRASSINDSKLRIVTEGPMTGVSYLVRTITLEPGKNALEFYLDGERIRRNTYSLR